MSEITVERMTAIASRISKSRNGRLTKVRRERIILRKVSLLQPRLKRLTYFQSGSVACEDGRLRYATMVVL